MDPFLQDKLIRAGRTFAQAALAVLVAAGTDFIDVELWRAAAVSGGAAVLSYLQSLVRER